MPAIPTVSADSIGSVIETAANTYERRGNNARKLIHEICRQFSDATGWTMRFSPLKAQREHDDALAIDDDEGCCWHSDVHDGHRLVGRLRVELPDKSVQDGSFATVRPMADLVAGLVNRQLATYRMLESRTRQVATLVELGLTIPDESDLPEAISRLLRAVTELTGFRAVAFFLLDPSTKELNLRLSHVRDGHSIPLPRRDLQDEPPDLNVLMSGIVRLRRDQCDDGIQWLPDGTKLGVGVPVASRTGPIGTLWAFDRRLRTPSNQEIHILQSLATQIAVLLERAVLLRESASQHRIQRELRTVSEGQRHPLVERLPDDCGFEAALYTSSRHELGGDLCELIPIGEGRTLIAVGDASGDSIPAAIVMTAVRGALRALTLGIEEDILRPEVVLDRVNRALYSITPAHQFMSFVYGVFDSSTRTFTYSNAGHPGPLLVRDGEISSLESHGVILGVTDAATYRSSTVQLSRRNTLIFFSDGISEAMDKQQRMFRCEGIMAAMRDEMDGSAHDILQSIWRRYEKHIAGANEPDDRTLLIVQMK